MLTNENAKLKNVKTHDKEDYFKLIFSALKWEKYKANLMARSEAINLVIADLFSEKHIESLSLRLNYDFGKAATPLDDGEFLIYKVFVAELKKVNEYFKVFPNSNGKELFLLISGVFCVPEFMIVVNPYLLLADFKKDKDLGYILNPETQG